MTRNSSSDRIIEIQRRWAEDAKLKVDVRGYLDSWEANLRQPLSLSARVAFDQGSGSELESRGASPAKMRALHSSSALAVNVFDYWCGTDSLPLAKALELEIASEPPCFEAKFPTGLKGNPPNLDIVLTMKSGVTFAIESKFTEWLAPKARSESPFKDKYFESKTGLWKSVGLPECQQLAQDIQTGTEQFVHLDAPQLLKHALGLAKQAKDGFSLCYLYFDWTCPESDTHRHELNRFASRVDSEVRFRSMTYQNLFGRLTQTCGPEHAHYLEYLRGRYFGKIILAP
jgi:hypothetical protein